MSLNQYLHCANTEIREDVAEFLGSVDLTRGVPILQSLPYDTW